MTGFLTPTHYEKHINAQSSQNVGLGVANPHGNQDYYTTSQLASMNPGHLSTPSLVAYLTTVYITQ